MKTNRKLPYTFIVLRDRQRPALRFHLNRYLLLVVPALVLMLSLTSIGLYLLYAHHAEKYDLLHVQLDQSIRDFTDIIHDKDATIDELQSDLITLSAQAQEVQAKVNELKQLEAELNQITDAAMMESALSDTADKPEVTLSSYRPDAANESNGEPEETVLSAFNQASLTTTADAGSSVGGRSWAVKDESELKKLASEAVHMFNDLITDMDQLDARLEEKKRVLEAYREQQRVTPNIWPTESRRVTSHYGYRSDPFHRALRFHSGIDIGGKLGDPIYAAADGTVTASDYDPMLGHHIEIDHGTGVSTIYMHLKERLVDVGDQVEKRDEIGKLGSTGRSTGPHLHYEVLLNGRTTDPRSYLPSLE